MFGMLEAVSIPRAGVYNSYEDLIENLNERMEKQGYKIVKSRSHRSRMDADITRCDLVCDRGGRPYKSVATERKTTTKKTGCPWKAKAVHRKSVGGWVLTVVCDQHNHEPGTPEPPSPEHSDGEEENVEETNLPALGPETSSAIQVAGVSETALRLTGDTFSQFKRDYRKLSQPDRMQMLANLQMRIAVLYALQNEDVQRQRRQEAQDKRHQEIEANKRPGLGSTPATNKRQRQSIAEDANTGQRALHVQEHLDDQLLAQQLRQAAQARMTNAAAQTSVSIPNSGMGQFPQFAGISRRGRLPNP